MATLPIYLEVEDVAVGPVLIVLRRMPGIIKMNLDLEKGAPTAPALPRGTKASNEQHAIAFLMKHNGGPLHVRAFMQELGGTKSRAYGALHQLKKKGVVKSLGAGNWELTEKAKRQLINGDASPKLLPAPANGKSHKAAGRTRRGNARDIMLRTLAAEPKRPFEIAEQLDAGGASAKAISGVLDRARRDKLVKKVGDNYELTAAGKHAAEQRSAAT